MQKSYNRLNILNDEQELRSVFLKLPEYLQNRWARINRNCNVSQGRYLTFEEISLFVQDEADLACDPLTAISATTNKQTNRIHSRAIESNVKRVRRCWLCKENHLLDDCKEFLKKTLQQRSDFAVENKLCFGCLRGKHKRSECRIKPKCKS